MRVYSSWTVGVLVALVWSLAEPLRTTAQGDKDSRTFVPSGKLCRPKNADGYAIWSGEGDTPTTCRGKCEADSDRCGAWEFENHSVDDHECELHETTRISTEQTAGTGDCEIPADGSLDGYRCCWILEELTVATPSSEEGSETAIDEIVKSGSYINGPSFAFAAIVASATVLIG